MIIHNNYTGLTIYMCHPKEKYDAIFAEYMHNIDAITFWSETEKRILSIAHEQFLISDLYEMRPADAIVIEVGDYSIAVKSEWFTIYNRLPKNIGLSLPDNKLMLAKQFIINEEVGILYFDEHVRNLSLSNRVVELCCVIKRGF